MTSKKIEKALKSTLPKSTILFLKRTRSLSDRLRHTPRVLFNKHLRFNAMLKETPRVHLGCDTIRLPNFINIDIRPTSATDVAHSCVDLRLIPSNRLDLLYSQMFFEHVFFEQRGSLLREGFRVLKNEGYLLFTGIPNFELIAAAYLDKRCPGFISNRFDLFEVYRQTHGAPESQPGWWIPQLHKSLFDNDTCLELLRAAGFRAATVFNHLNISDPYPLCLGFIAKKTDREEALGLSQIVAAIEQCRPSIVCTDAVSITGQLASDDHVR